MEIGTDEKALRINLDSAKYGTFAEIGAGQEVARRFFRVGGAAGTVAKTMSAYDMTFSDAIYGSAQRYVSRVRLHTMLDHDFNPNHADNPAKLLSTSGYSTKQMLSNKKLLASSE